MAKKKQYTVRAGDNPARIAEQLYGDQRYFNVVMDALGNIGGRTLRAGQVLELPDLTQYQKRLRREGLLHEVTQAEWRDALAFSGKEVPQEQFVIPPLELPLPPGMGAPPGPGQVPPVPGLPLPPGASVPSGAYPGILPSTVVGPYDPANPALLAAFQTPPTPLYPGFSRALAGFGAYGARLLDQRLRPKTPFAAGFRPPLSTIPSEQDVVNLAGRLTGTGQAAMLEQALTREKAADTYQVRRGVYTPIRDAQGNIIGYELAQTGEVISVPVRGGLPGAYVGQGPTGRIIGGGEGYKDLVPPSRARDYVKQQGYPAPPTGAGGGGGGGYVPGGGRGGGEGGEAPSRGAALPPQVPFVGEGQRPDQQFVRTPSLPSRYRPPMTTQGSGQPQTGRTPFRSPSDPTRVGLITWRI